MTRANAKMSRKMKINRGSFNLFAFGFRLRLRLSVAHKLTKFQACRMGNVRVRLTGTHHTFSGHFPLILRCWNANREQYTPSFPARLVHKAGQFVVKRRSRDTSNDARVGAHFSVMQLNQQSEQCMTNECTAMIESRDGEVIEKS